MSQQRSAAALAYRRLYRTPRWRALRSRQLQRQPLCWMCIRIGRDTRATIVDHATPHRGDLTLFFDPANLRSLCAPHHDSTKQRAENGRVTMPVGCDGWPQG